MTEADTPFVDPEAGSSDVRTGGAGIGAESVHAEGIDAAGVDTASGDAGVSSVSSRPSGALLPSDEVAARVWAAIAAGQRASADKWLAELRPSFDLAGAWRLRLDGARLELHESWHRAALAYQQGFTRAFITATGHEGVHQGESLRLGGCILLDLGRLYRRMDRSADAEATHLAALRLIRLHGSGMELWQVRHALGLDAELLSKFALAGSRFSAAVDAASSLGAEGLVCQGESSLALSRVMRLQGRWDEAISAAEAGVSYLKSHDSDSPAWISAQSTLGSLWLDRGQYLLESAVSSDDGLSGAGLSGAGHSGAGEPDTGGSSSGDLSSGEMSSGELGSGVDFAGSLAKAISILRASRDELRAFGTEVAASAAVTAEQLDFAERLLESVDDSASG